MCGIVGVVGVPNTNSERELLVKRMAASIAHRGPDGAGLTTSGDCTLGFRRLAIIDVDAPSPPFPNEDRSVWTVCNGQIYNAHELRTDLESKGHNLGSETDTEVVPHLYEDHGLELVHHLNGMFALAVWDARLRRLILARDRAGEKPLFYWQGSSELVFASELRALLTHPRVPRTLDPVALRRYLLHDFFPAPLTPFSGIRKLPAGHILVFENGTAQVRRYWDFSDHFGTPQAAEMSRSEIADRLDAHIARAVRRRSRSDVPFGVFLSGGIDSSTVLSHVAEQQGEGVPVFSLGHEDQSFDESRFARRTAEHFGADYHELILNESDLEEGLRLVAQGFDEPLGDASTIPTHLLSRLAREHVKVVLSGEGADELFAGYPTYLGAKIADGYQRLPGPLRSAMATSARRLAPHSMGNVGLDYLLERFLSAADRGRIERHHSWFGSLGPDRLRETLAPHLDDALAGDDLFSSAHARVAGRRFPDALAELLYTDFTMYLQDGLLTKVDRAAMLASLEVRAPFLDHELAEFAAGIPSRFKLKGLTTKAILRDAVRHRLPREVLGRRKRGFNIPFSRWLLHGLGDRLRERFAPDRVAARALLSPEGVKRLLDEHLEHRADHRKPLFTLMMLDMWCDRVYGEGAEVPVAEAGQ
ncbi:MAG: asparagine synthase (glutamine-hydrolyzing) [Thermoanaerobaculales bacterium]|nr:asparagine synthase (glutamine-hydrolyzing) [Thermoanaerobaculales bacterium]